jgi:(S)-mandelate dehydrogenase
MTLLSTYEDQAAKLLPRAVYDYYAGGADDETTLAANRQAFAHYALRWSM